MQMYKFSCNYDEIDWNLHINAESIEEAYSKLDEFDRQYADYVSIDEDLYRIEPAGKFTLVDLTEELPF